MSESPKEREAGCWMRRDGRGRWGVRRLRPRNCESISSCLKRWNLCFQMAPVERFPLWCRCAVRIRPVDGLFLPLSSSVKRWSEPSVSFCKSSPGSLNTSTSVELHKYYKHAHSCTLNGILLGRKACQRWASYLQFLCLNACLSLLLKLCSLGQALPRSSSFCPKFT